MKGYKIFRTDNSEYGVGKIYRSEKKTVFYKTLKECLMNATYSDSIRVAKVVSTGKVMPSIYNYYSTRELKIIREVPWEKVFKKANTGFFNRGFFNTGNDNTGYSNTGSHNTGNHNTGEWNIGYSNTGNHNEGSYNSSFENIGDFNTGKSNIGNFNVGNGNIGNSNVGNGNTGSNNIGDFNVASYSVGCFNTVAGTNCFFNKTTKMTLEEWHRSKSFYAMEGMLERITQWVYAPNMTKEEKEAHPEYIVTGGFLKKYGSKDHQEWWDNLNEADKKAIRDIPNFNENIFYECTGIKVD